MKRGGLDWNDLRYFLAAVRAGTLAGAARALGVKAFDDRPQARRAGTRARRPGRDPRRARPGADGPRPKADAACGGDGAFRSRAGERCRTAGRARAGGAVPTGLIRPY